MGGTQQWGLQREGCHGLGVKPRRWGFPSAHLHKDTENFQGQGLPVVQGCSSLASPLAATPLWGLGLSSSTGLFLPLLLPGPLPIQAAPSTQHPVLTALLFSQLGAGSRAEAGGEAALWALRSVLVGGAGGRQPAGGLGQQDPSAILRWVTPRRTRRSWASGGQRCCTDLGWCLHHSFMNVSGAACGCHWEHPNTIPGYCGPGRIWDKQWEVATKHVLWAKALL